MRWVKPSMTTVSPSWTKRETASRIDMTLDDTNPSFHDRFLSHDRADRHAAAEPLGREQHIRLDPLMLARPHFAGPSYAALYLVAHEQDAVAVAQLPQRLQIAGRRHHVAALALDRLHEHRGDALRVQPLGEQVVLDRRHTPHGARGLGVAEVAVVAIAVGHVVHLGEERREAGPLARLTGREAQPPVRAAVERARERDDGGASRRVPRELDRAFDRFGSR